MIVKNCRIENCIDYLYFINEELRFVFYKFDSVLFGPKSVQLVKRAAQQTYIIIAVDRVFEYDERHVAVIFSNSVIFIPVVLL